MSTLSSDEVSWPGASDDDRFTLEVERLSSGGFIPPADDVGSALDDARDVPVVGIAGGPLRDR